MPGRGHLAPLASRRERRPEAFAGLRPHGQEDLAAMPDVRVRMAREPAGGLARRAASARRAMGKGALSRQGQQQPRIEETGRRQAAPPRSEWRPARRGPSRPRGRHGVVARQVRPRLSDGRPRQGEGQAGLLLVLLWEEEAREADKARLALGPSARKERGASAPPACRRDLANIGLGGHAWQL